MRVRSRSDTHISIVQIDRRASAAMRFCLVFCAPESVCLKRCDNNIRCRDFEMYEKALFKETLITTTHR